MNYMNKRAFSVFVVGMIIFIAAGCKQSEVLETNSKVLRSISTEKLSPRVEHLFTGFVLNFGDAVIIDSNITIAATKEVDDCATGVEFCNPHLIYEYKLAKGGWDELKFIGFNQKITAKAGDYRVFWTSSESRTGLPTFSVDKINNLIE